MWLLSAAWVLVGIFDLIKAEFLPERFQSYTVIRLLGVLSWHAWVIVFLILIIGVLLEGGHAAIQKRNKLPAELERKASDEKEALEKRIKELEEITPDLMLSVGVEGHMNKIFVENTGPGTARQINLHCQNEDSKLLFNTIPYLSNGQKIPFKTDYLVDKNFSVLDISKDLKKYMREKPEEPGIQIVIVEQLLTLLHRNERQKLFRQDFVMFLNKNNDEVEIHPNGNRYHVPNV